MPNGSTKKQNSQVASETKLERIEKKIEKPVKRYVRFLHIDEERQKKVAEEIKEKAKPDLDFVLLTIFSTIIVALGLIINNVAVVIGGMLIAPLLWPILALALGVIKGNVNMMQRSFFTILKASLIIFLVSFIVALAIPYLGESQEVMLRTKPTLVELFIALAAGFIGAFAVAHPKLSAALAGVVAAVALVPPLAVMGILFAQKSFILAGGAALLYLTNFLAITFAAIILFLVVGIKFPRRETSKNIAVSNVSWFIVFLVIIAIPLTLVMKNILEENKQQRIIQEVIGGYTINTEITKLKVDDERDLVIIEATLQAPYELTSWHVKRLTDILVDRLGSSVNLKINVVATYEAGRSK